MNAVQAAWAGNPGTTFFVDFVDQRRGLGLGLAVVHPAMSSSLLFVVRRRAVAVAEGRCTLDWPFFVARRG